MLGKLYISLHCIEYCYFPCLCYCWSRCLVFVVFPSALDFYFLLGCHLSGCACGDFRFCFCFCFVFFICLDFCFLPACQVGADLRIHPSSGLLFPFERSRLYYIFTNNTISLCLLKCKTETCLIITEYIFICCLLWQSSSLFSKKTCWGKILYGQIVNCPSRWSLYCHLDFCIYHLYREILYSKKKI